MTEQKDIYEQYLEAGVMPGNLEHKELREKVAWLYNPHAKPAKELSKHDQQMIKLGWDAAKSLVQEQERKRIMAIFASLGKIQLEKPLSGKEFEALFD